MRIERDSYDPSVLPRPIIRFLISRFAVSARIRFYKDKRPACICTKFNTRLRRRRYNNNILLSIRFSTLRSVKRYTNNIILYQEDAPHLIFKGFCEV